MPKQFEWNDDNSAFLFIAMIFFLVGLSTDNTSLSLIGIVFFILAFIGFEENKDTEETTSKETQNPEIVLPENLPPEEDEEKKEE